MNSQASPEKQKASIAFLEWLYSSDEGKEFVTEKLGFIPPFSTFTEEEYPTNPLAQEVMRYMNNQDCETVKWVFSTYPSQTFKEKLGRDLLSYSSGEISWDILVNDTKAEWNSEKAQDEQ